AVAANSARLGRLPGYFTDDRMGIAVIWGISAVLIPVIREVVVVESYYAFGFVSAFVITSTTVFFVRKDALRDRGIEPGSSEARSLRFAGLRGMIASYFMLVVLVTQKTEALIAIIFFGALITLYQFYIANGGLKRLPETLSKVRREVGVRIVAYDAGLQRAHDQARQRGIADSLSALIAEGRTGKFNTDPDRIVRLVSYLHNVDAELFRLNGDLHDHDHIEEPSEDLEATYNASRGASEDLLREIEYYSHFGIFTFIHNYYLNWVAPEHGRNKETVLQAMLHILFPLTPHEQMWEEYCAFQPRMLPEAVWQFSRERYRWAKDQWPNLSDRITTIWTLQDFGLVPAELDVKMVIAVAAGKQFKIFKIHTHGPEDDEPTEQPPAPVDDDKIDK
ncbi:MAG: hypothetical protein KC547_04265, partial [Anaerolineae bacterium]|nr:hypothetical protein [Anaerolineae bacterium]